MPESASTSYGSTSFSLLYRVRADDQDGWRRLVRLYGPLVLFWCRRAGVPQADRADVFREVFRAVARYIGDFQRERTGSFRAWLRVIVHSKAADHFARRGEGEGTAGGSGNETRSAVRPTQMAGSIRTPNEPRYDRPVRVGGRESTFDREISFHPNGTGSEHGGIRSRHETGYIAVCTRFDEDNDG